MDSRFCSIVLVVDLQQDGGDAEAVAAGLAQRAGLPIDIVAEVSTGSAHPVAPDELHRRIAAAGLDRSPYYLLPSDDPGRAIAEHVTNREGVLLVTAATTWGSGGPYLLDAQVEEMIRRFRGPVLVIGPKVAPSQTHPTTAVAVVDGSDIARPAMTVVEAWVRTLPGAAARVVEVLPIADVPATDALRHVRGYLDQLADHGIAASGDVLRGSEPAPALAAYADEIDGAVVVVSSPRWAGEPSHWFNTTRRLIHLSTRPVLVVPADLAGYRGSSCGSIVATTSARPG
jgi:hypothetical protein